MSAGARPAIAIVGSGEMGSAVGRCLVDSGFRVRTALDGRSRLSRERAADAGMLDRGGLEALAGDADLLLSILPPALAVDFARRVCPLLGAAPGDPLFVDCNAVAPATLQAVAAAAADAGVRFQDVGIVGPAPRRGRDPVRFYTSGPCNREIERLESPLIAVRPVGAEPGQASALKMVYASMTKGTHALRAAAMMAAVELGVEEAILEEWRSSMPDAYRSMQVRMPRLPMVAGRWAGEMREIATTYESLGLTPSFHEGAEWVYELVARMDSATAAQAPGMSVDDLAAVFAALLKDRETAT